MCKRGSSFALGACQDRSQVRSSLRNIMLIQSTVENRARREQFQRLPSRKPRKLTDSMGGFGMLDWIPYLASVE